MQLNALVKWRKYYIWLNRLRLKITRVLLWSWNQKDTLHHRPKHAIKYEFQFNPVFFLREIECGVKCPEFEISSGHKIFRRTTGSRWPSRPIGSLRCIVTCTRIRSLGSRVRQVTKISRPKKIVQKIVNNSLAVQYFGLLSIF